MPLEEVVYPAVPDEVDGAVQPDGTVTVTAPFDMPPAAAEYVNANDTGEAAVTEPGDTVADPDPSGAYLTLTVGEDARAVDVPVAVDFSDTAKLDDPTAPGDTAELAPPPAPYVTVRAELDARVTPLTVIVWPATLTVPLDAVVYPAVPAEVDGALHPDGTTTDTAPLEVPPAAAV